MEKIKNYYKETIGKELDLNIEVKLTQEQENYVLNMLLRITNEITEVLHEWVKIVYMNLIVHGEVA